MEVQLRIENRAKLSVTTGNNMQTLKLNIICNLEIIV